MERKDLQPPARPQWPMALTTSGPGDTIEQTMGFGRPASAPPRDRLLREESGAVFVEYVTILLLVTVIGAAAVAALGIPLLHLFRYVQAVIVLPIP